MKNIFYKSDIKIIEGYPGTDDFVYHYFTQKGRSGSGGDCRIRRSSAERPQQLK